MTNLDTNTEEEDQLTEGWDDTGGFVLNGFQFTGAAARMMMLTSRPEGIHYPELCKVTGWKRCRTTVKRAAEQAGYIVEKRHDGIIHVIPNPKLRRRPVVKPMKPLLRVAQQYDLPLDTFTSDGHDANPPRAKRMSLWVQSQVYEAAVHNIKNSGLDVQEVLASAIARYATQRERKPARNLSELLATPVSQLGLGAGIDHDGEYRHVRFPNLEGRREEWLGNKFADLVTAMRNFAAAVPPGVQADYAKKWLAVDPKNTSARQAKLNKAKAAFEPLAQEVLAMLKELEQPTQTQPTAADLADFYGAPDELPNRTG